MKRKVFISVAVPERTRKTLERYIARWENLPVKWTKKENLYLTLLFLGYMDDADALQVAEKTREVVENWPIFDVEFDKIILAPKEDDPSFIWLAGEPSEPLKNLHEALEKSLGIFTKEKKAFRPHLTLGRLRKNKWKDLPEKPSIDEPYSLILDIESVVVLASGFSSGDGGEYTVLENCPLL